MRSAPRTLSDGGGHLSRPHVHEGGGRSDAERAEQELGVLCRVDTEQREDGRVRHTAARPQDVGHVHRQLDRHAGDIQARECAIHGHVQTQGLLALVYSMSIIFKLFVKLEKLIRNALHFI